MDTTWIVTPAFCKASLLEKTLEYIYREPLPEGCKHIIIDNHYPVNKHKNRECIQTLAAKYSCIYVDSGIDLGWHHGVNRALKIVGATKDDLFVGFDPDDRPEPGVIKAFQDVMTADPTFAVIGTNFHVPTLRKLEGVFTVTENVSGHDVWIHPSVEMWNVCAMNLKLVFELGGFRQLAPYYGGLEIFLHSNWIKRGMRLGYLANFTSEYEPLDKWDTSLFDHEYHEWKVACTQGFLGSFEQLLIEKHPHQLGNV